MLSNLAAKLRSFGRAAVSDKRTLDRHIEDIERQREALRRAIPHTDDICAWLAQNIDAHAGFYRERLAAYLNDRTLALRGWPDVEGAPGGFPLFKVPDHAVNSEGRVLAPTETPVGFQVDPINPRALVALLAPLMKEQLRPLVLQLVPASARGIRGEERQRRMRELDERLQTLHKQRDELQALMLEIAEAAEGR